METCGELLPSRVLSIAECGAPDGAGRFLLRFYTLRLRSFYSFCFALVPRSERFLLCPLVIVGLSDKV